MEPVTEGWPVFLYVLLTFLDLHHRLHSMALRKHALEIILLMIGILIIGFTLPPARTQLAVDLRMVPPPKYIERFAFGYQETIADLLWIRLLQDIDICETAKNGVAHPGDGTNEGGAPKCRFGWVYQMVDAITTLTPHWKLPFRTGALMLSIVVDDIDGATKIFEKGIALYPYDYSLNYNGAYHYIWEVKNPKRASELLIAAAKSGGPAWLYSLAGKLISEEGKIDLAIQVLEDGLKETRNDRSSARIETRLKELREKRSKLKKEAPSGN